MTDKPKLEFILGKTDDGKWAMWACRGEGKGCDRNRFREQKTRCDDCYGPLPDEMTLGEVYDHLTKGDA